MKFRLFIVAIITVFGFYGLSCKESKKKKPSNNQIQPPPAEDSSQHIQNSNNTNPLGIVVSVDGQSGNTFKFAALQAVNLKFNIQASQNVQDLSIVMTEAPSGSQLLGRETLNPQFTWIGGAANTNIPLTLLIRDLKKCQENGGGDSCTPQLVGGGMARNVVVSKVYDAEFRYTLEIVASGAGGGYNPNYSNNTGGTGSSYYNGNHYTNGSQVYGQNNGILGIIWNSLRNVGSWLWNGIGRLFGQS